MDFLYFFRIILKRKWFIIGAGMIACISAYFFTRNEEKIYKSSTHIATGFIIKDQVKIVDENISFFEADARFNNAIITWESEAVVTLLSYALILHDLNNDSPFRVLTEQQKELPAYTKIDIQQAKVVFAEKLDKMEMLTSFKPEEKELLDFLELYNYDYESIIKRLDVKRLPRTDYIVADFLSENPELSAFVVNVGFQQFLRYYRQIRDTRSLESSDTLRSIMEKKKTDLDYKRSLLTGEGIINPELEATSSVTRITDLEKSLTEERTKQTKLYYELRKVNQRLGTASGTTENNTSESSSNINENTELLTLKKTMNETYENYVNGGATDESLLARYNQLKAEYQTKIINSTAGTPVEGIAPNNRRGLLDKKQDLELDIQASQVTIATIESRIGALRGNAVQDATKAANLESLMKEVDLANKEYLAAKQKYSEAIDITVSNVNNFRQVISGQPGIIPERSKRKLIIGIAAIAAVLTSTLVILLLAYLDSSIKTPKIFTKTVELKLISMVNFMNLKKKNLADIVIANGAQTKEASKGNRLNVFRESIRKLRFAVESSGKKTFLFTSTKKGEGKTTLIMALSYSMIRSRKRILIIDTNFCNNDLTVRLNADPILEKIEFAKVDSNDLEKIKSSITDIGNGYVFVLGSEGGDYTPSEILPTGNILQHLEELTKEYDYIFLEGPPLNDFSDSRELAQYVDAVIAIFSSKHIIKQIDKESIDFFKQLNGKFCGSVLNMVDMENINVT